jgi:peptide/nickel transport system permease protein
VLVVAVFADQLPVPSPVINNLSLRLKPPGYVDPRTGRVAWLGTDQLGRDLSSRVIYGSRISLTVGFGAVVVTTSVGLFIGMLAGFYRGWVESLLMRLIDLQLAFPFILLVMAIIALIGPSLQNIVVVLAITSWPKFARTVRASVLSLREQQFVEAARSIGVPNWVIIWRHLLPNLLSPVIVLASFEVATMIIAEASLGFLGLGVQPPTPTWGNILADGRDYIGDAWWIATLPGLAIMLTAAGVNFLGDGLRDLLDPRLQHIDRAA